MRGWGGKSPKRTTLWSNSTGIRYFATSSKYSRMKSRTSNSKLADVYYDKAGRKRYKGNRRLKKSQCETYSPLFHQNDFELFSYVHDGPYTHGFSAIVLAPHAKGIPEWIWKAICRFNETPHQRKRISSPVAISGAFVGYMLFCNCMFSWLAIHKKNGSKYYRKTFGRYIIVTFLLACHPKKNALHKFTSQ